MKRYLMIFCFFVLAGCGALPENDGSIQPGTLMALAPKATPLATVRGTATVDYAAQIGRTDLLLHQAVATATVAAITQQVIDTAQAKLDASRLKTGTAVVGKTQTVEAQAVATADRAATGTVQAPLTEREWVRTNWEPVIQAAYFVGLVVIGLFICWAIYALAYAKYMVIMATMPEKQPAPVHVPELPKDEPVTIKLDRRDEYGWGAVDWDTLPIDQDALRDVAGLIVLQGARFTHAQMTGDEKPLIKGNTFEKFGAWMVKNKIAVQGDDKRYAVTQKAFFQQVLRE